MKERVLNQQLFRVSTTMGVFAISEHRFSPDVPMPSDFKLVIYNAFD